MSKNIIEPYGGILIDRRVDKTYVLEELKQYRSIVMNALQAAEFERISDGSFSPLEGFMNVDDCMSVLERRTLANGLIWPIPIIFPIANHKIDDVKAGEKITLKTEYDGIVGVIEVEDVYELNLDGAVKKIYGTGDKNHPGVNRMYEEGNRFIGGKVSAIRLPYNPIREHCCSPKMIRDEIVKRGWENIAGFQTRNVPHMAHEYIQRVVLEMMDGLLIHPIIGWKKKGDFKPSVIIRAYEKLVNEFYRRDHVIFSCLSATMFYAGPLEAVLHAIIRRNYGCSHFIVGRDHAGVGSYYGKYDAHKIFDKIGDIGIKPLRMHGPYYCKECEMIVTEKVCSHKAIHHDEISGTKLRNMIMNGEMPPKEWMRPEISKSILEESDPFIN